MIGPRVKEMTESTPICRCRVLYLGSSVPQQTKDGLQGIQEPLQELYPDQGATGARGIDSWLSVWSNGILLENVDENHKKITRFFPIESLHYCAAVRFVLVPEKNTLHSPSPRFLPLDSPFARAPNPTHPPLFAAILRRTTGIKVLECHAFICKREVAANALVRCCFHAYADSSYAKQVDTAGSIYGTLATPRPGSTTTLNTLAPPPPPPDDDDDDDDDESVYNGDENHKVWAGSQDHLDSIYDVYTSSTIGRSPRPRQAVQAVAVAPPPAPKETKKSKKMGRGQQQQELYPIYKANSVSGTMMKPRGPPPPQPVYIMAGPPPPHHHHHHQTLPNPKFFKGNTFSHRPRGKMLIPARPIAPPLVPMLLPPKKVKKGRYGGEEPIYVASKMALHHHHQQQQQHEAYLMQQQQQHYATMESMNGGGKKGKGKKLGKGGKAMAQSMNGLDEAGLGGVANGGSGGEGGGDGGSPFNTGIYRKKGHLNERAFSYSIRQEHRSRSYGSLANLKFATPISNGDMEDREDIKKEREIMQMVQDLDLSGDELERSEVPRNLYETRGGPAPVMVAQSAQINGRGHRR